MTNSSLIKRFLADQFKASIIPARYVDLLIEIFFSSEIVSLAARLALIGFLVHVLRSRLASMQDAVYNGRSPLLHPIRIVDLTSDGVALFVTVHTRGGPVDWIRDFLQQDADAQRQLVQSRMYAEDETAGNAAQRGKWASRPTGAAMVEGGVCFRYLPFCHRAVVIRHEGRKLWITRVNGEIANEAEPLILHYRLTAWRWQRRVITDFTIMAHRQFHEKNDNELHIFNHTPNVAKWEGPIRRPARPWASVILPTFVKDNLLNDVEDFISEAEREWYTSRGIPHRRGYLLHGPPGTGKTTMATALASKLQMDLYIINPGAPGMDNGKLEKCFRCCPRGSMLLIEDIDCVMPVQRHTKTSLSADYESAADTEASPCGLARPKVAKDDAGPSSVTLSGLLNAIDGVSSQEDSVLFASTNYLDKLDEALRRPGRFDVHVPFDYADKQQVADLYKHFYPVSDPRSSPAAANSAISAVGAQAAIGEKDALADLDAPATEFAKTILPEGTTVKLSIATIQAYLLLHKKDPAQALAKAKEWVDGVEQEQLGGVVVVKSGKADDLKA